MNDIFSGTSGLVAIPGSKFAWDDVCLHELIQAQVVRTPDAPAVRYAERSLTYRALNRWANRVAHELQQAGIGPDRCVGVCVERSVELVVALLATLKAGGAYLPLDPNYPRERLSFIVGDAETGAIITTNGLRRQLGLEAPHVVLLDGEPDTSASDDTAPESDVTPKHLAYNIYTSGSTGLPKGALNTHEGICNRLLWMQQAYGINETDRILQKTPFSFDVSVWEFFLPLMSGAQLVVARPEGHKDPAYLAELIEHAQITVMHFVPSMLRIFLQEPELETRCRSLRHVFSSGEALTADLRDRFYARFQAQLHNLYGPTEAAVDVTHYTCPRDSRETTVPIGYPVANTQIYIVNDAGELAGPGEMGEIIIGGVQVARGYHNRPQLNAERFVPDTFSGKPRGRLFRTGDLGRCREDGAIEFFGRRDHQIKIRGLRVELGEIEAVLAAHPGVHACAVTVHKSEHDEPQLVAHVVPDRRAASSVWQAIGADSTAEAGAPGARWSSASDLLADVRRHLGEKLPDYMVPGSFRLHRELPLTPSGKVDRAALPGPSRRRPELPHPYAPPRTPLERYIADLWCQILDIEQVGIEDRFFELGGDSLRAARFINQLRSRLDEFIYITTIFEAPTVAQYAAMLERDYPRAVAKNFGGGMADAAVSKCSGQIDEQDIERLRDCVPTIPLGQPHPGHERNTPALFILAPPRSGTTLLRVMLAGHPGLFAAPELQLLGFETLEESRRAYTGPHALWLEGGIRALMEVHACNAEEAKRIMADLEQRGFTTREFYHYLQEAIGDRMLVDKSPSYAMDPYALARAERDFDEPLYVHLVRHPYAMVTSFESYHMDQVLYLKRHDFNPRQLGELVWLVSNENILEFLARIPGHRQYAMRYEDLVTRPRLVVQEMCARLGIPFDEGLLRPYDNLDRKMTDGLQPDSTPMGDTHLFEHTGIDARVAARWRGVEQDNFLSEATWQVAEMLGYERPAAVGSAVASSQTG
jgi:amino acid adenylation domain-containing protein